MSFVRFVVKTSSRHSWRCKQQVNLAEHDQPGATSRPVPVMQSPNVPVTSRTVVKCCWGKICKICNFADNYGYCETVPDQNLITKYKEYTVKDLKKALQHLKSNKGNLSEIKYVSRALRDKLRINSNKADGLSSNELFFNHD